MISMTKKARVAGGLYVVFILLGVFDMVASAQWTVAGDATATMSRVLEHPLLFRFDVLAGLITAPVWIAVVLALYWLLEGVNRNLARLMVILVLVQVPVTFLSATHQLVALELGKGASDLVAFGGLQQSAIAMLLLHINGVASTPMELFWGLWLFPLGILVYRSRFLPWFIGVWLNLNGIAYVVLCIAGIFAPEAAGTFFTFALPFILGEIVLALWLVIFGARGAGVKTQSVQRQTRMHSMQASTTE